MKFNDFNRVFQLLSHLIVIFSGESLATDSSIYFIAQIIEAAIIPVPSASCTDISSKQTSR